jgi:hypothetical protein
MYRILYRPKLKASAVNKVQDASLQDTVEHYEFLCQRDRSNFEVISLDAQHPVCRYYFDVDYKGLLYSESQVKELCCGVLLQFKLEVIYIGTYINTSYVHTT